MTDRKYTQFELEMALIQLRYAMIKQLTDNSLVNQIIDEINSYHTRTERPGEVAQERPAQDPTEPAAAEAVGTEE
jgi:hypothetical protein